MDRYDVVEGSFCGITRFASRSSAVISRTTSEPDLTFLRIAASFALRRSSSCCRNRLHRAGTGVFASAVSRSGKLEKALSSPLCSNRVQT